MTFIVTLCGWNASTDPPVPTLGTRGSYGTGQLRLVPGEGWQGLALTATFHPPGSCGCGTTVPAGLDGLVPVPPEATAKASGPGQLGKIVIRGVADGVCRCTANLPYSVVDHAGCCGQPAAPPTPGVVDLVLAAVQQDRQDAQAAASDAATSAGQAATSAGNAATSAQSAQDAAALAAAHTGNPPVIRDGTWWVWQQGAGGEGGYIDTGQPAQAAGVPAISNAEIEAILAG